MFFSRPWLFMTCHFALLKVFLAFFFVFVGGFLQCLIAIGLNDKPLTGPRYALMRVNNYILARILLFTSASCLWVNHLKPKFCYKKYLGPDWKPDYDLSRTGSLICNHSAFLDAVMFGMCVIPSHITKGEVQDVPGVGRLC